jgi:hypothetical protein
MLIADVDFIVHDLSSSSCFLRARQVSIVALLSLGCVDSLFCSVTSAQTRFSDGIRDAAIIYVRRSWR